MVVLKKSRIQCNRTIKIISNLNDIIRRTLQISIPMILSVVEFGTLFFKELTNG